MERTMSTSRLISIKAWNINCYKSSWSYVQWVLDLSLIEFFDSKLFLVEDALSAKTFNF